MIADDDLERLQAMIHVPTDDEFREAYEAAYEAALHPVPLPAGTPMCAAPGCRRPLPPPGRHGPPRQTCSNACRVRAWRATREVERSDAAVAAAMRAITQPDEELAALLADLADDGPEPAA